MIRYDNAWRDVRSNVSGLFKGKTPVRRISNSILTWIKRRPATRRTGSYRLSPGIFKETGFESTLDIGIEDVCIFRGDMSIPPLQYSPASFMIFLMPQPKLVLLLSAKVVRTVFLRGLLLPDFYRFFR